jgi:hypothetical protein
MALLRTMSQCCRIDGEAHSVHLPSSLGGGYWWVPAFTMNYTYYLSFLTFRL